MQIVSLDTNCFRWSFTCFREFSSFQHEYNKIQCKTLTNLIRKIKLSTKITTFLWEKIEINDQIEIRVIDAIETNTSYFTEMLNCTRLFNSDISCETALSQIINYNLQLFHFE